MINTILKKSMLVPLCTFFKTHKNVCFDPCSRNLFLQAVDESLPVRCPSVSGAKLLNGTLWRPPSRPTVYMATTGV